MWRGAWGTGREQGLYGRGMTGIEEEYNARDPRRWDQAVLVDTEAAEAGTRGFCCQNAERRAQIRRLLSSRCIRLADAYRQSATEQRKHGTRCCASDGQKVLLLAELGNGRCRYRYRPYDNYDCVGLSASNMIMRLDSDRTFQHCLVA